MILYIDNIFCIPILAQNTSNDAVPRKEVPFGGRETNI